MMCSPSYAKLIHHTSAHPSCFRPDWYVLVPLIRWLLRRTVQPLAGAIIGIQITALMKW